MLTVEQNNELTQVGPGTPMGELLRRYWYPIAFEQDFDTVPARSVRLLSEDWTLYKTPSGKYGIIQEKLGLSSGLAVNASVKSKSAAKPFQLRRNSSRRMV